jgi:sugar phosphate isomerase/epimerase
MSDTDVEGNRTLARKLGLNRRQFLAATTALAAGAVAGAGPLAAGATASAGRGGAGNGVLVPPGKRGIILYTVRDAVSRNPLTSDPSLASGFRQVFEVLSGIGYQQIEFAGLTQNANSEGGQNMGTLATAPLLKQWLDDYGLEAEGNHGTIPGVLTPETLSAFRTSCEVHAILGMSHIGTGNDPVEPRNGLAASYKSSWDLAIDRWNTLGQIAMDEFGLKLYTHNHDQAYSFLLDSGPLDALGNPTRSSGVRRLEYFMDNTDPDYVFIEMDIYWAHVAQHRFRTFTDPDGYTVEDVFDPLATVNGQRPDRFPLFHAKDGRSRPDLAAGYEIVPFGAGDIDYQAFFSGMVARGYHNPMWEQDNAPGGSAAPGQSLELAQYSYDNLAALRG